MKVIFNDESRMSIGDDAESFFWNHSNETYQDDCMMKTSKLLNPLLNIELDVILMILFDSYWIRHLLTRVSWNPG